MIEMSTPKSHMYIIYYIRLYICIRYIYYIYVIMKTVCPPGYHHNGFVATHVLALCVSRITYDHLYIHIYIID